MCGRRPCFLPLLNILNSLLVTGAVLLPPPQEVYVDSINMKHLLRWRPLQVSCGTVRYSVQFQGEFELRILNGSWENASACQWISRSVCDMSTDLASDSDYYIRVRAECEGLVSDWTSLRRPFNRKDTTLTVPAMRVSLSEAFIQVDFTDLPPAVDLYLTHWRRGEELKVSKDLITAERNPFFTPSLEQGTTYCFRATALLETVNKSNSTDEVCISTDQPWPPWLKPTSASVAVTIVTALAFLLLWSARRYCHNPLRDCCSEEPLPSSLLQDEKACKLKVQAKQEATELCQPILVLQSQQELDCTLKYSPVHSGTTETKPSSSHTAISHLLSTVISRELHA